MGSLTFLGTGTSTGVPMIGCRCDVCRSSNPKDRRLRSSVFVRQGDCHLLVDTATDLRAQALAAGLAQVDAVLFTHHHADHVHGIDELRSFTFFQNREIPCYGTRASLERIRSMFSYIFDGNETEGGGKPRLSLHPIDEPVEIGGALVVPIPVLHGSVEIFGYRFNNTAYITDCSEIPAASMRRLEGLDTLILGALGLKRHATHFTIERALEAIGTIRPKRAYLTHLNHSLGHDDAPAILPENVALAWDGLTIDI